MRIGTLLLLLLLLLLVLLLLLLLLLLIPFLLSCRRRSTAWCVRVVPVRAGDVELLHLLQLASLELPAHHALGS